MWFRTECVYLTAGAAHGGTKLNAFDNALRAARIADFNLIRVTSIVPADAPVYHLPTNVDPVAADGRMLPVLYDWLYSTELHATISAAIGVGLPAASVRRPGIAFVYTGLCSRQEAKNAVRAMVEEAAMTNDYIPYECKIESASIVVDELGAAVIAAAVFCDKDLATLFPNPIDG